MPHVPFEKEYVVPRSDIDGLGHVNNIVYLHWLIDMAESHSAAMGWPVERYTKLGAGWAVRKHEIEYLLPAREGDRLILRTWVAEVSRCSSRRRFEVFRPADGKVLTRGATLWAWIDYKTGRLDRVPASLAAGLEIIPDPVQG